MDMKKKACGAAWYSVLLLVVLAASGVGWGLHSPSFAEDSTDLYGKVDQVIYGLVPEQDYQLDEKSRSVMLTDAGIEKLQQRLKSTNLYAPEELETLHHVEQALRLRTRYPGGLPGE